jgi:ribosome-binding factor A
MYGSKRQQKFSKLIQKELAEIFQKEGRSLFNGQFITMTEVRSTPDLSEVRVYLSMEFAKDPEKLIDHINHKEKEIRLLLEKKKKNKVRSIPRLKFFIDEVPGRAARIEEIFRNLDIPPAED